MPIALSIAGSDPSGGAGIQADLKTFAALGVYGAAIPVALTAQNTLGVQGVHPVPAGFVAAQLSSVFDDLAVDAVKTGMLADADIVGEVAAALAARRVRSLVVDPVMVASSGDRLLGEDAIARLRDGLFPLATVVTPNLPEAAALLGEPAAADEGMMLTQGRRLLSLGPRAVLMKGGHGAGPEAVDILVTAEGHRRYVASRVATNNTHGTGCTLSAAIAAGLARSLPLEDAVAAAKAYVTAALAAADRLHVGHGRGPLHHFHALWRDGDG
ncbi:MAG TPA: bifunctional hydroxymethylpyrimidine kinase/phosphomethylpyrimidine kinase [Hyphomicrobiales bacterium]|nr:bifunctional hydroxymethylpyrimidine kinase/phosphomethylpyrimidine kinase [Hyphomicrobiales bacterium]